MTEHTLPDETPCWYVKDYADGWIRFYDVSMAINEAMETGAIMRYSADGRAPIQATQGDDCPCTNWDSFDAENYICKVCGKLWPNSYERDEPPQATQSDVPLDKDFALVAASIGIFLDKERNHDALDALERIRASKDDALLEALKRIRDMCDVPGNCKCGRPNGIPAVKSCAETAIAAAASKGGA